MQIKIFSNQHTQNTSCVSPFRTNQIVSFCSVVAAANIYSRGSGKNNSCRKANTAVPEGKLRGAGVAVDTPATEALAVAMEKTKQRADAAAAARDCDYDNGAGAGCGSRESSDMIQ